MSNPSRIIEMASAFYDSQTLFTAADLGVFSAVQKRPGANANELAAELSLHPRGARLLLDGCVAIGLLTKDGDGYTNTPESALFLVQGSPADLSGALRYNRDVYPAWGNLSQLAQTGAPVEKPEIHLGDDPERTRTFVLSMHSRALAIGRAVVPLLKLDGCKRLFDVGGGPGAYSCLIAKQFPEIECTVLDLPGVVAVADELIAQEDLQGRVQTTPGDYHTATFPDETDAIIFFGMLHQESPESILDLFKRARASLRPGGIVYVMDMMTDASHTAPKFSALFAINMALTTEQGWVFSDAELEGWLTEAGFENFSVAPLPAPMPHWLACARVPE